MTGYAMLATASNAGDIIFGIIGVQYKWCLQYFVFQQTQLKALFKEEKDFYLGEFVMAASFEADSIATSLFGNMIREIWKYDQRDLEI